MNRKLVWSFCLLALALCAMPAMAATTLYTNLGTGSSVYNCCTGWTISGTGTIGTSFIAANEFQVTTAGTVGHVDLGVGYVTGDNSFYMQLYKDNGLGHPDPSNLLFTESGLSSSQSFGGCCGLVSFDVSGGPSLSTGVNYWMVLGPTSTTATTWEAWNFSNSATGTDEYSTDGGLTWNSNGTQPQGAFDILGGSGTGTTPEPSSLLLFGTGIVGAFAAFRRKLNL